MSLFLFPVVEDEEFLDDSNDGYASDFEVEEEAPQQQQQQQSTMWELFHLYQQQQPPAPEITDNNNTGWSWSVSSHYLSLYGFGTAHNSVAQLSASPRPNKRRRIEERQ